MKLQRKSFKSNLLIGVLVFLFLYMPPLFSINMIHILSLFVYIILFFRFRGEVIRLFKNKYIFMFMTGILFSLILVTTTILFTSKNFVYITTILLFLIEIIPCVFMIIILFEKYGYELDDIFDLILVIAFIQSVISIATFVNPSFRQLILNQFYYEEYVVGEYSYITLNRIYGLASGMTFAMPVVQGYLAALAFSFSLRKSYKYAIYIPALVFSAMINARTGLVIFIVGCLFVVGLNVIKAKRKNMTRLMILVLVLILITPILLSFIRSQSEISSVWIEDAYNETLSLFKGEKIGYYSVVGDMIFFPDIQGLLFGTGEDNFGKVHNGQSSDIGYVNDLFLGGLFFTLFLYISFIILITSGLVKNDWERGIVIWLMLITMILANIKGSAFRFHNITNLFILLSCILIFSKDKIKYKIKAID